MKITAITYTLIIRPDIITPWAESEIFYLSSKTDLGARRQAKKIIKEQDVEPYRCSLNFWRQSDGCSGEIDL